MNLIRSNDPFDGLSGLHKQLDDMFNSLWAMPNMPRMQATSTMDIYHEDDKQMVVEVHAPGFAIDDISVQINDGVLEISGQKQDASETKDKQRTYMIKESSASFYRRVKLPRTADTEKISAHFDNGALSLHIPFKELPQPTKVPISSASQSTKQVK